MDGHRHTFLSCPGCGAPFIVHQEGGIEPQVMDPAVPSNMATSYLEARKAFTSASAHHHHHHHQQGGCKGRTGVHQAIVEYLFVFEAAFQRFKERRAKLEAAPAGQDEQLPS